MQRSDENEKNEINQTLPTAVSRDHKNRADVHLPAWFQLRNPLLSVLEFLVGSTPARAKISDWHGLLGLRQVLLSYDLSVSVGSLSSHVNL